MKNLDLNIPEIKNYEEYKELWNKISPVEIKMIEKYEDCKHDSGDTFIYKNPYKRPDNVCFALLHVLDLYIWRVALGFPSWEEDDKSIFRIHCPDKLGTVWQMRRL